MMPTNYLVNSYIPYILPPWVASIVDPLLLVPLVPPSGCIPMWLRMARCSLVSPQLTTENYCQPGTEVEPRLDPFSSKPLLCEM